MTTSCLFVILVSFIDILSATGGGGYAGPFVYGPVSTSNTAVFGSPGLSVCYRVEPKNNVNTLVCCEAKGFDSSTREQWTNIGCGYSSVTGCVDWGNVLAQPDIECKGNPTGTMYLWSH